MRVQVTITFAFFAKIGGGAAGIPSIAAGITCTSAIVANITTLKSQRAATDRGGPAGDSELYKRTIIDDG